jgi:hypothetical protein
MPADLHIQLMAQDSMLPAKQSAGVKLTAATRCHCSLAVWMFPHHLSAIWVHFATRQCGLQVQLTLSDKRIDNWSSLNNNSNVTHSTGTVTMTTIATVVVVTIFLLLVLSMRDLQKLSALLYCWRKWKEWEGCIIRCHVTSKLGRHANLAVSVRVAMQWWTWQQHLHFSWRWLWRMSSSGIWHCVALVRTDVLPPSSVCFNC